MSQSAIAAQNNKKTFFFGIFEFFKSITIRRHSLGGFRRLRYQMGNRIVPRARVYGRLNAVGSSEQIEMPRRQMI